MSKPSQQSLDFCFSSLKVVHLSAGFHFTKILSKIVRNSMQACHCAEERAEDWQEVIVSECSGSLSCRIHEYQAAIIRAKL